MSLFQRLKATLDILSTIAVIVVAGVLIWTTVIRPVSVTSSQTIQGKTIQELDGIRVRASTFTKRIGDAHTVIIEFGDFQCPYCGRHAKDTFPRIRRELIDQGIASYAYFHFPLQQIHDNAFGASEAAECAGRQHKYWEMHERLYANQAKLTHADLISHAQSLGLDPELFSKCLSHETADAVTADIQQAQLLKIESTPTFFVGIVGADGLVRLTHRISGAVAFETFKEVVRGAAPRRGWSVRRWFSL